VRGRAPRAGEPEPRPAPAALGPLHAVAERLVEDGYLRGGARLFEEGVGVGLDLALDQLGLYLVVDGLQLGDDDAGRDAAVARDVNVLVVGLDLLRRDDGEGAEAEVEVLLHVDAVVDDLAQLLGGEADALQAALELFLRGEALDELVSASSISFSVAWTCGSLSAS
jgi:hypothetical protein